MSESVNHLYILSTGGNFMCISKRAFSNAGAYIEFRTILQKIPSNSV